ncbi:MAG TPA: ferritin-like domain-containing protein [Sphingomicrobium sp.]|nr:ferritin-like domain-containing protein [Sphingomicrobium sp.]
MEKTTAMSEAMERISQRRSSRREFLRAARGTGAAVAGAAALTACFPSGGKRDDPPAQPPPQSAQVSDADVLNFALNLEYLEAQFYFFAAFGEGLPQSILSGTGVQGGVTGGRRVNFSDPIVRLHAVEIARDERAHVEFLRRALGSAAVAQPPIDISSGPDGPFSAAARAAGLITAGQSFDPYASDENFLLGAYIFEDVGVTAYKGASPLITNKTFLEAAAGILAVEAYHAGLIRTTLFEKGSRGMQTLITATERISDARDSLDNPADQDQGVAPRDGGSNIVPADQNAIAFSRNAPDVLNIVYLTAAAAAQGGFFPRGVNGPINRSSAF